MVWGLEHVSFGCIVTFGCVTVVTAQLQPWCPLLASHPETLYEPLCHHCDVCSIATIVASISTQSIQLYIATIVARTFVAIYKPLAPAAREAGANRGGLAQNRPYADTSISVEIRIE